MKLSVKNFAQIADAEIDFGAPGDLTILVGQQATGKSLLLQWLKLMCDRPKIREDWNRFGTNWQVPGEPLRELDVFFGEGMGAGYSEASTEVLLDKKKFSLISRQTRTQSAQKVKEAVYFIPAQRALLMAEGWPRPFSSYVQGTPYVARAQSERLLQWLANGKETIFPISRKFSDDLRTRLDETIFHGASVLADRQSTQSRLLLGVNQGSSSKIPYMAWTAGQREFVPLLMALYRLLTSSARTKDKEIDTVVIEELELGLHPKAVFVLGQTLLRLMARGYRVAISTHSPLLVDLAWTIQRLKKLGGTSQSDLKPWQQALSIPNTLAKQLQDKTVRTYYLAYDENKMVTAKDISELRTDSADAGEAAWGLMTEDSIRMSDIVSQMNFDFRHGE
jgi:AAA domain, putative AbiEii toxin, Type IV TA system